MTFNSAELTALIAGFFWPFLRISALFISMPLFGTRLLPVRIRVLLAFSITLLIAPLLPDVPQVGILTWQALLISIQQILIGLMMGFVMQLVFSILVLAGHQIASMMGLGFASMIDPQNGVSVPVISQFLLILGTLLFLVYDGHTVLITVIFESFTLLPVSVRGVDTGDFLQLAQWAGLIFKASLQIALPIIATLLTITLALGVITRAAPQLNIFSIGFPIGILSGYLMLLLTLPALPSLFEGYVDAGFHFIRTVVLQ
ncbi:MAG: flagellar biosynthetic protein FliR [Gammaproteobacteria bacterium]|nr:flagellar biosynthetic protein FliR [Gammaproteobacteria bacterium]